MHYLLFLFQNIDYINCNFINHTIWAKLLGKKLDPTSLLTKWVKIHILHNFYKNINLGCIYIKNKNDGYRQRYKADYPK